MLDNTLTVWTDSPELLYGAAFIGISPNNHFNNDEFGSTSTSNDKQLKISAVHPLTGDLLPIFVSENLDHASSTDSCLGKAHFV